MALFKKLGLFKAPAGETAWQPPSTLDHGAVGRKRLWQVVTVRSNMTKVTQMRGYGEGKPCSC